MAIFPAILLPIIIVIAVIYVIGMPITYFEGQTDAEYHIGYQNKSFVWPYWYDRGYTNYPNKGKRVRARETKNAARYGRG